MKGKLPDIRKLRTAAELVVKPGNSDTHIAKISKLERTTVLRLRRRLDKAGINSPEAVTKLTDEQLFKIMYPNSTVQRSKYGQPLKQVLTRSRPIAAAIPDFEELVIKKIELQMSTSGIFSLYQSSCKEQSRQPLQRSAFFRRFSECEKRIYADAEAAGQAVLIKQYNYGEEVQIDYAGDKVTINLLGEGITELKVLVMIWPATGYLFAAFVRTYDTKDACEAIGRGLSWFGVKPKILTVDNTKTFVIRHVGAEPVINASFEHFVNQMKIGVHAAPVRSPRSKGAVEAGVRLVQDRILPSFNNSLPPVSLEEANCKLQCQCNKFINQMPFRKGAATREELFNKFEKPNAAPLLQPYPKFVCVMNQHARIPKDYHVTVNGSRYSVPYQYLGCTALITATDSRIFVYVGDKQISSHVRHDGGGLFTHPEHCPPNHRAYLENYALERKYAEGDDSLIVKDASKISREAVQYCMRRLSNKQDTQRFNACIILFNFYRRHPEKEFVNEAVRRTLAKDNAECKSETISRIFKLLIRYERIYGRMPPKTLSEDELIHAVDEPELELSPDSWTFPGLSQKPDESSSEDDPVHLLSDEDWLNDKK